MKASGSLMSGARTIDTPEGPHSARRLRELLDQHALAAERFRELVARSLGVTARDAAALVHFSPGAR